MTINRKAGTAGSLKAAKAISLIWISSVLAAGLTFLVQAFSARQLGPYQFGLFASSLATVTLLSPVAGFGVSQVWLKVFGREKERGLRWIVPSLKFNALTIVTVTAILVAWALLGPHDKTTVGILLVLSVHASGQASLELVSSKFQIEERYFSLAAWQVFPSLLRLLALFVLVAVNWINANSIAGIYALVAVLLFFYGNYQARQLVKGAADESDPSSPGDAKIFVGSVAEEAWPFGLAALFNMIYSQIAVVLVKYMVGNGEAGIYNIAYTVLLATYLLPGAIFQKYLVAKIHRWDADNPEMLRRVFRKGNLIMSLMGFLIMLLIVGTSWLFVPLVFGAEYREAVLYLNVLSISIPFMFVAFSAGSILVSGKNMQTKVKLMGGVAVLNVILNLTAIPRYGALGASIASVVSNFVLMVLYFFYAKNAIEARCSSFSKI
ncbi:flippase [Zoogloea sp. LCSB751]|uniref:flippase n=1 Tax=Zoogloea sp. LCSB751 TaxID=1965277 RepID=UPI0009A54B6F|nr:flippase [Zoogloea sp. LCSB751]